MRMNNTQPLVSLAGSQQGHVWVEETKGRGEGDIKKGGGRREFWGKRRMRETRSKGQVRKSKRDGFVNRKKEWGMPREMGRDTSRKKEGGERIWIYKDQTCSPTSLRTVLFIVLPYRLFLTPTVPNHPFTEIKGFQDWVQKEEEGLELEMEFGLQSTKAKQEGLARE